MPTREYRCRQCGHQFKTVVFKGDEKHSPSCPECGNRDVAAAIEAVGLFKGVSNLGTLSRDTN